VGKTALKRAALDAVKSLYEAASALGKRDDDFAAMIEAVEEQ
jgi:3-hydroxyisobutyrate dehydrogenase-like beta-hydroxyacid dehydrogenase